jgi:23S rRNA pseudouridine1911/1915/1917 synthase
VRQLFRFQASTEDAGKRLDKFAFENLSRYSRMFLADLIRQNLFLVNGETQPGGYHLKIGDAVEIAIDSTAKTAMTPENIPLEVLFEDSEILVVNKPAGMLVHPTNSDKTGTLANALVFHLNGETVIENPKLIRPGIVHRLDKETSGLLVTTKTPRALRILGSHFQRKLVKKIYAALVEGVISENEGTISAPIGRLEEKPHWRVLPDGKESETKFKVLERRNDATLLELEPVTGRTNQLRIHCAEIKHPIVGDALYGGREFARLCLHAQKLGFFHPNGGWLEFETALPSEMQSAFTGFL